MLRLIGILTGSALAVAFLIVVLGPPRLSAPTEELVVAAPGPVPEFEEAVTIADTAPVAAEPADPVVASVENEAEPTMPDAETAALIEEIFAPQPVATEALPADSSVDENWYAFWSPFRSEIAANGFVAKLQETTGIDYRVVKVKTGVYEVAFAYVDDADIEDKLARISSATGLDMTGG